MAACDSNKIRYETKIEAEEEAHRIVSVWAARSGLITTYFCRRCDGHHLTTKPQLFASAPEQIQWRESDIRVRKKAVTARATVNAPQLGIFGSGVAATYVKTRCYLESL